MYQDNPPTEIQYWFPTWVTGIFYGGQWHDVAQGKFREGVLTDHGDMTAYEDPFSGEKIFITEKITGYRVKEPEPQASVTELHPKK